MKELLLPPNCYGIHRSNLVPQGIIAHAMSALYADRIGLSNADPYDVEVCFDILKHYEYSAHVIIDREGTPYQLVPFDKQAYHAGISLLNGREDCNRWTLSIECLSVGKPNISGEPAYTEDQVNCFVNICRMWMSTHPIELENISTHTIIRDNAIRAGMKDRRGRTPPRKWDPGSYFPMDRILTELGGGV